MFAEVQQLEPERRHFLVKPAELTGLSTLQSHRELRKRFGAYRIGLAPVLFDRERRYRALRRAAFLLAPTKILAYNERLERHHLRLRTAVASILFLRGVPLDRIFLRPWWLVPWKRDRSIYPSEILEIEGRPYVGAAKTRGSGESLFSVSALARRSGSNLPSAARNGRRRSIFSCSRFWIRRRRKISRPSWNIALA